MRNGIRFAVFALCFPDVAHAQEARIDSLVRAARASLGAPGISVAVATNGRITYSRGFGTADSENAVPATVRTVYRSASVTKLFTAVAVLRLVADGQMEL